MWPLLLSGFERSFCSTSPAASVSSFSVFFPSFYLHFLSFVRLLAAEVHAAAGDQEVDPASLPG